MNSMNSQSGSPAIVQQITTNTTSWIGHRPGETKNRVCGQTFTSPAEADLDAIEIFAAYVNTNGQVMLTIHQFDGASKTWGPAIAESTVEFKRNEAGKWITFPVKGIHLNKNNMYGFRLSSNEVLAGLGEAAGSYDHLPLIGGQEWVANSEDQKGNYYSYLSLAFRIGQRA